MKLAPLLNSSEPPKVQPLFYCFLQYRDIEFYKKLKKSQKTQLVHDFLESFCQVANIEFHKIRYDGPEKIRQRRRYEIIFNIFDFGVPLDQLFRLHFGLTNHWNYIFHWQSYKSWNQIFQGLGRPDAMLEDLRGRYLQAEWMRFHHAGRFSMPFFYDIYKFMNLPKCDDGGLDPEFTGSGYADLHPNDHLLPDFWKIYMPWKPETNCSSMWKELPDYQQPSGYKKASFEDDDEENPLFSGPRIVF